MISDAFSGNLFALAVAKRYYHDIEVGESAKQPITLSSPVLSR